MAEAKSHAFSIGFDDRVRKIVDKWVGDHGCTVPKEESVGKVTYFFTLLKVVWQIELKCKCGKSNQCLKLQVDNWLSVTFGFDDATGAKIDEWLNRHTCPGRDELSETAVRPAPTYSFYCEKGGGEDVIVGCGFGHKFGPIDCHASW